MPRTGGRREGAGRPKGSLGEARKKLVEIHQELERAGKTDPAAVIQKLYDMATSDEGDGLAAKEYLNRRFGTSPESLEITDNSETLFASDEEREAKMRLLWGVLKERFEK